MKAYLGLLWLFVIIIGAACGGAGNVDSAETPVTDLSLTASDIAYDAESLEVVANRPVRLSLENAGVLEHDFTVRKIEVTGVHAPEAAEDDHDMSHVEDELALHVAAPPNGGSNVLEFTPTEPGEYEFYCTVSGHKEAGMIGTLVVSP
jgi:uncharacterized cupredoxin-like copper-binding protein